MKCDNCGEEEVAHEGEWCDNCNLPEKQHPFNTSPAYNPNLRPKKLSKPQRDNKTL